MGQTGPFLSCPPTVSLRLSAQDAAPAQEVTRLSPQRKNERLDQTGSRGFKFRGPAASWAAGLGDRMQIFISACTRDELLFVQGG